MCQRREVIFRWADAIMYNYVIMVAAAVKVAEFLGKSATTVFMSSPACSSDW